MVSNIYNMLVLGNSHLEMREYLAMIRVMTREQSTIALLRLLVSSQRDVMASPNE